MTQPRTAATASEISTTRSESSLRRSARRWAATLCLWRLCGNARCRRAAACRGDVEACFRSNFPLLPEGVQEWFYGVGEAQEAKLPFDQAMDWLDETPAGKAFHDWRVAVGVSLRKQKRR